MSRASGTFEITAWDQVVFDEGEGAALSRVHNEKAFGGGLQGTSSAELLMAVAGEEGAAYVGVERVLGSLEGRRGTFVLHHSARSWDGSSETVVVAAIVPGSGTGELAGLRGEMAIERHDDGSHTYSLEYAF